MNKHTIELNIPEGYEPDEGEQPRAPLNQDEIWMIGWNEVKKYVNYIEGKVGTDDYFILRKKKPVYETLFNRESGGLAEYVEIKALEDAMKVIENLNMNPDLDMFECNAYGPLKELVG